MLRFKYVPEFVAAKLNDQDIVGIDGPFVSLILGLREKSHAIRETAGERLFEFSAECIYVGGRECPVLRVLLLFRIISQFKYDVDLFYCKADRLF